MTEKSVTGTINANIGTIAGKDNKGLFDQPLSPNENFFKKKSGHQERTNLNYENLPAEMKEKVDKLKDIFHVAKLG